MMVSARSCDLDSGDLAMSIAVGHEGCDNRRGLPSESIKVVLLDRKDLLSAGPGETPTSENADVVVGWMHGDEPDNAQPRRDGSGYGPPILPRTIVAAYERIRHSDSSRPVLLNLGQGVAFDQYIGRGVRRNHPEIIQNTSKAATSSRSTSTRLCTGIRKLRVS